MAEDATSAEGLAAPLPARVPARGPLLGALMRVELAIARVESAVAILALAVAIGAVGASVAIRGLNLPIPDVGEWAIVAMSPLTFVGAALCTHLHRHLTADLVEAMPHGGLRRGLEVVSTLLCLLFGYYFISLSYDLFDYALTSGERLIDLGTPVAVPVGFMLAGAVLMTFHAALDLVRVLSGHRPGGIDPWR